MCDLFDRCIVTFFNTGEGLLDPCTLPLDKCFFTSLTGSLLRLSDMPGNQVGHRPCGHIFMKLPKGQFFIRLVFFVLAILFFELLRQRGNETVALALEVLIKLCKKASVLSLALLSLDLEWFIVDHSHKVIIHLLVVARILIYRNSF